MIFVRFDEQVIDNLLFNDRIRLILRGEFQRVQLVLYRFFGDLVKDADCLPTLAITGLDAFFQHLRHSVLADPFVGVNAHRRIYKVSSLSGLLVLKQRLFIPYAANGGEQRLFVRPYHFPGCLSDRAFPQHIIACGEGLSHEVQGKLKGLLLHRVYESGNVLRRLRKLLC